MSNYQATEATRSAAANSLPAKPVLADGLLLDVAAATAPEGPVRQGLHHLQAEASALGERGAQAVHEGAQQLRESRDAWRESAQRASERTRSYIQGEPVKAVLAAAAVGAVLTALLSLVTRSRR